MATFLALCSGSRLRTPSSITCGNRSRVMRNRCQLPFSSFPTRLFSDLPRVDVGDLVYHVVNRANSRRTIFETADEYKHVEMLLEDAFERFDMRLLAYTLMPNHWHLLLYPRVDGDLSRFMQWLTLTHTQQYHVWKQISGYEKSVSATFFFFSYSSLFRSTSRRRWRLGISRRQSRQ